MIHCEDFMNHCLFSSNGVLMKPVLTLVTTDYLATIVLASALAKNLKNDFDGTFCSFCGKALFFVVQNISQGVISLLLDCI